MSAFDPSGREPCSACSNTAMIWQQICELDGRRPRPQEPSRGRSRYKLSDVRAKSRAVFPPPNRSVFYDEWILTQIKTGICGGAIVRLLIVCTLFQFRALPVRKTGRKPNDPTFHCWCLCLSHRNVSAGHVARATPSAGQHDRAGPLGMRSGDDTSWRCVRGPDHQTPSP